MIRRIPGARRSIAGALLIVLTLQSACYSLDAEPSPAPAVGMRVVARLSEAGSTSVAPRLGPGAVELEGRVISAAEGRVTLAVTRVGRGSGLVDFPEREVLELPAGAVAELREKRLNRGRSALFGVVFVGGALLVARAFGGFLSGDDDPGGGPVPPN
jgi:hypothetical protein